MKKHYARSFEKSKQRLNSVKIMLKLII